MVGAGRLSDGERDERGCIYGSGSAPGPGPAVATEWCGGESECIQLFSRLMMARGEGHSNHASRAKCDTRRRYPRNESVREEVDSKREEART
jgi:hypothetical protein